MCHEIMYIFKNGRDSQAPGIKIPAYQAKWMYFLIPQYLSMMVTPSGFTSRHFPCRALIGPF